MTATWEIVAGVALEGTIGLGCVYFTHRIYALAFRNAEARPDRRVKTAALRAVQKKWRALYRGEIAAKAVRQEHRSWKQGELVKRRQGWATEFEELAGHTWDGSWTEISHPEHHAEYYANAEHWAALTDPERWHLIREQDPIHYSLGERPDAEKRRIARDAADKWRAAGAIDHRSAGPAEQRTAGDKVQRAIAAKKKAKLEHQHAMQASQRRIAGDYETMTFGDSTTFRDRIEGA